MPSSPSFGGVGRKFHVQWEGGEKKWRCRNSKCAEAGSKKVHLLKAGPISVRVRPFSKKKSINASIGGISYKIHVFLK